MDSKAGKIIIAASGVVAAGAALWYIWKKFIDVDDEEEEEKPVGRAAHNLTLDDRCRREEGGGDP